MSWTNATGAALDSRKGVLYPERTPAPATDFPVSAALAPFVERYWTVHWTPATAPAYGAQVLSHPCVNLSVQSGTEPLFGFPVPAVLVHGVVTRRFTARLAGSGSVCAVKFRPGGYRAFTGSLPGRDTVVRLGGLGGVTESDLLEAVLAHDDDAGRAAALDTVLAPLAPQPEPDYLQLLDIVRHMLHDRELVRAEAVAELAGLTLRGLQRLFSRYVGVGPKALLARYRLHDAVAVLDAGEATDLAALAAGLGWCDQAHFTRDFRAVVGVTPAAYQRRAAPAAGLRDRSGG